MTNKQKLFADEYLIDLNATRAYKAVYKAIKNDETIAGYGVIYCITNLKNNKKYIGLTTRSIEQRFKEHIETDSYIGNAIRKHGVENFLIEQIDEANTKDELCKKEIYWIEKYDSFNNGYNQTIGGDGVNNVCGLSIILNEKQKQFIEDVYIENKKDIDIKDKDKLIRMILLNMVEVYLNCKTLANKKSAAKLIDKLKPVYKYFVEDFDVIDLNELKAYL